MGIDTSGQDLAFFQMLMNDGDKYVYLYIIIVVLQKGAYPDLVATSGDYLRVWRVNDSDTRLECLLNNVSPMEIHKHYGDLRVKWWMVLHA